MRRTFALAAFLLIFAAPAFAIDMPARKPGLWEVKMVIEGLQMPPRVMKQCTDAASDKVMNSNFGGSAQEACSKQDVTKSATGMIIDSVCKFGDNTTATHAVVTGSFDSAYSVDVASTRQGGPPMPGRAAGGATHMKIEAKWLGACAAGQKPGDVIMANGMTMNVLDVSSKLKRP
jgi:hypothetical protein